MSPANQLANAVFERVFHRSTCLERAADFERLDHRASQLRRNVVRKPEHAGHIEFQLLANGAQLLQAFAAVHRNACDRQLAGAGEPALRVRASGCGQRFEETLRATSNAPAQ